MEPQDTSSTRPPKSKPLKPLQSNNPKTQYLILYNFVSSILWFIVLGRVLMLVPLVGFEHVFGGVGEFAKWTQTAALLEVVHAAVGLVRAPLSTTIMQVSSRILLVWFIVYPFPQLATSPAYTTMLLAWSITEVIRYSYFVLQLSNFTSGLIPDFFAWCRYNAFFILYPLGISSECWLIYKAMGPAGSLAWGREIGWGLKWILGVYVPGSYILFTHMMKQRRKIMRGKQVQKKQE